MPEGLLHMRVLLATLKVQVEQVLPWLATQGTRLDLYDVQVAQSEYAQAAEQRSGCIPRREHQRGLPNLDVARWRQHGLLGIEQEEASEILAIIFDRPAENLAAINRCRDRRSDACSVFQTFLDHHLHAACSVVEGHFLDLRIRFEKREALIQRDGVREDPLHLSKTDTLRRNEVMNDADAGLRHDSHFEMQQMIVVFVN